MKITRANVEVYAKSQGLEPIQVDGIPDGFSYKAPGLHIGTKYYSGQCYAFIPLMDWNKGTIQENSIEDLLTSYNRINNAK